MSGLTANFVTQESNMNACLPGELIFGMQGSPGGYYRISAAQPDENTLRLTFTPSKNTMDPIDPVDIVLPAGSQGENGYTPVRGTDYWTEADIAEIRSYVDEAILGGVW